MALLGFTYRLKPNALQEIAFQQGAGVCRLIWSLALEQRRDYWRHYQRRTGGILNYTAQARELTALRSECDFIRAVSQTSQQYVLKALDHAFRPFYKGQGGYPQPKRKGVHKAFAFNGREIRVERLNHRWDRVRLPKIGWVRFCMTRNLSGKMTEATVSLTALGWHISLGCKDCDVKAFATTGTLGIDRGVAVPLMTSDGVAYALPEQLSLVERRARKAQRVMSRRKRSSQRYAIARQCVTKLKAKEARICKQWAHTVTTDICRQSGHIVVERLKTRHMTASASGTIEVPGVHVSQKRGLNRSILNVGWHQIETMLTYKASHLTKVDPRFTSQRCSCCGTVDKRSRKSQASFVCTSCGFRANADHNAALNILHRGNTPGVELSVGTVMKARTSFTGNLRPLGRGRC